MTVLRVSRAASLIAAGLAIAVFSSNANALTSQECSTKYKAAKAAGTLGEKNWNQFRKDECGMPQAATPPAATSAGNAVFPKVISPQFAAEKPAKARLHTCAAQYKANKASNGNGGLKWVTKGGGYWSLCNKKLKGA